MPTRIGNRSYPSPILSNQQRGVMKSLLDDPAWQKLASPPQTQIGNRSYASDPASVARPDETTGMAPPQQAPSKIMDDLHGYAAGLGKTPNDLTLPELNQFIGQYGGAPPKTMYQLPGNY